MKEGSEELRSPKNTIGITTEPVLYWAECHTNQLHGIYSKAEVMVSRPKGIVAGLKK